MLLSSARQASAWVVASASSIPCRTTSTWLRPSSAVTTALLFFTPGLRHIIAPTTVVRAFTVVQQLSTPATRTRTTRSTFSKHTGCFFARIAAATAAAADHSNTKAATTPPPSPFTKTALLHSNSEDAATTTSSGEPTVAMAAASFPDNLSLPTFLRQASAHVRIAAAAAAESVTLAGRDGDDGGGSVVVHAYVGNEACDADSICSAICMAIFRGGVAAATAGESNEGVVHVPVMPIPRADLALRREVLVLFELCGVDPALVVFIDELDLSALQAQGRLRLTLVDHNAVSGPLGGLGDAVVEIVDHHQDLAEHVNVQGNARDIAFDANSGNGVALVGSCCTLVAERLLEHAPALLTSEVARLLLGVILIDTINLNMDANKATPRDVQAVQNMSVRISWLPPSGSSTITTDNTSTGICLPSGSSDPRLSSDAMFEALRSAKFDAAFWRELSVEEALRYDYKQFARKDSAKGQRSEHHPKEDKAASTAAPGPSPKLEFGMSSVLCRLEMLWGKVEALETLRAFAVARGLDSLVLMTATFDSEQNMRRELLVFVPDDEKRLRDMKAFLKGPAGEFLQLRESQQQQSNSFDGNEKEGGCRLGFVGQWEMENTRPSRKQVAPVLMTFYESLQVNYE